jgi:hypothetical protein
MPTPDEERAAMVERIAAGEIEGVELVDVEDPHEAGQFNPAHGSNTDDEMTDDPVD